MSVMKKKNDIKIIIKFLTLLIGFIILVLGFVSNYSHPNICAFYILFICLELIFFSKKNTFLLLLFIFLGYFNYSIVFSNYLHLIEGTMFTQWANTSVASMAIYVLLVFWLTILLFFNTDVIKLDLSNNDEIVCENKNFNSKIMVYCLYIVLLLIFIFGFKSPEIRGERGSVSTLYEYSTIIFILCYYFGNKYKTCKVITTILLLGFALQNLLYGGRATALQLFLILYIFIFSKKYSVRKILPIGVLGVLVLTVVGGARGNLLYGGFDINNILSTFKNHLFTLDTAYSSYYTSLTFIRTRSMLPFSSRLIFFYHLILSVFLGGKYLGDYNLPIYTRNYFIHYYGGVLPYYFYFYFWWIGVVLIGAYISYLISKCNKNDFNKSSGLNKCVCVYFIVTSPRWFLYSSTPLTRGLLLLIITYLIAAFINKTKNKVIQ